MAVTINKQFSGLQDITYLALQFAEIKNPTLYFKDGGTLDEMAKLRTLYNNIRLVWSLGPGELGIALGEGGALGEQKIYKFTLSKGKIIFGFLIYIPGLRRIDLYTSENVNLPMIQWVKRKIVYKTYPVILEKLGIEKLLEKLTIVL